MLHSPASAFSTLPAAPDLPQDVAPGQGKRLLKQRARGAIGGDVVHSYDTHFNMLASLQKRQRKQHISTNAAISKIPPTATIISMSGF